MGRALSRVGGEPLSKDDVSRLSFRRIVLVGFMGSGKTTVARLLAEHLEWDFVDLDEAIEGREGRTIPQIFEEEGEAGFRGIEQEMAEELLSRDRMVLASGGGWPCAEGRLEKVPEKTLTVWLQVSPELALERVRGQGVRRPLLEVADPLGRVRSLISARKQYYEKAEWWVDTEACSAQDIVSQVIERLHADLERPLRS